jgi:hypothetical protein
MVEQTQKDPKEGIKEPVKLTRIVNNALQADRLPVIFSQLGTKIEERYGKLIRFREKSIGKDILNFKVVFRKIHEFEKLLNEMPKASKELWIDTAAKSKNFLVTGYILIHYMDTKDLDAIYEIKKRAIIINTKSLAKIAYVAVDNPEKSKFLLSADPEAKSEAEPANLVPDSYFRLLTVKELSEFVRDCKDGAYDSISICDKVKNTTNFWLGAYSIYKLATEKDLFAMDLLMRAKIKDSSLKKIVTQVAAAMECDAVKNNYEGYF